MAEKVTSCSEGVNVAPVLTMRNCLAVLSSLAALKRRDS